MTQFLDLMHVPQMTKLHAAGFDISWSEADFETHVENAMDDVIGVVEGDALCGFVVLRTQGDQAEVLTITVASERQGCGLGAKILAAGERAILARGADIVFLDVAKDAPAAIRLYQKTGYQRCGTRKGYYRRSHSNGFARVDALLFSKKISD